MSVCRPVIETEDQVEILLQRGHIGKCLVAARRILDKNHLDPVLPNPEGFHPSEA